MEFVNCAYEISWLFLLILLVVKHVVKWFNIRQHKRQNNERNSKASDRDDIDTPES